MNMKRYDAYAWNEAIRKLTSEPIELNREFVYQYGNNDEITMHFCYEMEDDNCKMKVIKDLNKMYDEGEEIIVKSYDLRIHNEKT